MFNFQQADFDMLLVNLRMDAVNVKENMRISWVSESGMVDNIMQTIKEYKDSRKLQVLIINFKIIINENLLDNKLSYLYPMQ